MFFIIIFAQSIFKFSWIIWIYRGAEIGGAVKTHRLAGSPSKFFSEYFPKLALSGN